MNAVTNLTLKQAREKLGAKQDEMGQVMAQAKTDEGYDFSRVTYFGADVKGTIANVEKFNQLDAECNELAKHAETLEAAERAAKSHADREKAGQRPPLGFGGKAGQQFPSIKSLGEAIAEQKGFKAWSEGGASGGISLNLEDLWPTDMLAKAAAFETIGSKALMATGSGFAVENFRLPGFVEGATRPLQLLDIIPTDRTSQAAVKYMEETTRTHAAAELAEGGTYAESTFAFTEKTSTVQKIGDSLPITDEQLEDVPMMQGYVNGRLSFGVRQRLDQQSLIGSGTGSNLRGLKNVVGIQTQAKGADPVPDAFFKAMMKIRVTGRAIPTHHVIHPTDWQGVRLLRTVDGVYIWGSPSEAGPDRMWGLPVVLQDADVAGTGYVGSFQPAWVSLFERQGVDVQLGFVGTQFVEGKRTVRADMRAALVFFRPAAFCSVTGL